MNLRKAIYFVLIFSAAASTQAAITIDYDNATGDYTISGTDAGPGMTLGLNQAFLWTWDSTDTSDAVASFISNVTSLNLVSGTVNAQPITSIVALTDGGLNSGFGAKPQVSGALAFDFATGTTDTGLWSLSDGTFTSVGSFNSSTSEALTLTIVPEPSTYPALFGLAALGVVCLRRRVTK